MVDECLERTARETMLANRCLHPPLRSGAILADAVACLPLSGLRAQDPTQREKLGRPRCVSLGAVFIAVERG
jgi:hypothetical protein